MKGRYIGFFGDHEGMVADFGGSYRCDVRDDEIIAAAYGDSYGYSGTAYVYFERDGKVFEVYGSHCSCYGLEDDWDPSEVTKEYIRKRLSDGDFTGIEAEYREQLCAVLTAYLGGGV